MGVHQSFSRRNIIGRKMKVIPAILTNDSKELKSSLRQLKNIVKRIQIDFIDGDFVENKTLSFFVLNQIDELKDFEVDLHLMAKNPIRLIEQLKSIKINRFIAHIEELEDQSLFINKVLQAKMKPGLAIDLDSSINLINKINIQKVDIILLLAVKAGFAGQKFNPKVLGKIKKLKELKQKEKLSFEICVDGGISFETAKCCFLVGADSVAVGSFIWQQQDIRKAISSFE